MRAFLFHNSGLKLLALLLAVVIWFSITGQRRERVSERGYSIPLTVINIPQNAVIISPIPDSVDVRLRATFTALRALDPSKMEAVVDLAGTTPGEKLYRLTSDDINVPEGVDVVSISPSIVRLRLEKIATRDVPIVPRLQGSPATGLVARGAVANPAVARLAGPSSALERIASVSTDPVSLDDRSSSFTATVPVSVEASGVRLITPHVVTVRVLLQPAS
jgi:YbbR domain-containing protein